jgi:hypothetical protein
MNSYPIYQMVQAEQAAQRARCAAHQRQADAQLGELAAAMAQCFQGLRFRGLRFRGLGRRGLARPAAAVRTALRRGRRGGAVMDQ